MAGRARARATSWLLASAFAAPTALAGDRPAPPVTVRFGVIAEEPNEPDRMFTVYSEFVRQLRERLAPSGIGVGELSIARDLDDLAQRIANREVDFVLETVFPMLALRQRSRSLDPALLVVRRGQREYRSVFFTRQESPIQKLADLRGRTLVLQALRSTSAFALPRAELARARIRMVAADETTADASTVRYVLAQAEINQAVWVLHGKGHAGSFNESDWEALPEKIRGQLRIFARSRPILRGLVAFRDDLETATRQELERVMVGLHGDEAGRAALARAVGVTRFERLTPAEKGAVLDWAPVLLPAGRR